MLTATLLLTIAAADLVARGATIKLPDGFAERSTRIEFTGFGGFNRGSFRGADYRGDFVRTETRWGIFDPLYVLNRGRSSFTLEDAGGTVNIEASCRVTRDVLTYRIVTVDVDKMSYECHYSGPDAPGARFALGEPKREGFRERLAARERRIGEAFVLEQQFVIESVHNYEGTRLTSQKPLGYMIESDGIVVAAVDML
ncbi:MAG: hypothetical protein R3305_07650, partial [Gammaproteobacteria bacterium]|nr:hypothetical protein [Gammaproteobacteria bacterium]